MSDRRIWEELYGEEDNIKLIGMSNLETSLYENIRKVAEEIAYDNFLSLKNKYESENKDNYRKYKHSIEIKKIMKTKNLIPILFQFLLRSW